MFTLRTKIWKRNFKEIRILITVSPHIFSSVLYLQIKISLFYGREMLFFINNLRVLEIIEWESWINSRRLSMRLGQRLY